MALYRIVGEKIDLSEPADHLAGPTFCHYLRKRLTEFYFSKILVFNKFVRKYFKKI